jgi:hypothetical protein
MNLSPDTTLETIGLFLTFVWPGLLAVNVYRLIVPGPRIEWKDAVTQGLFFTVINYILTFPVALFVVRTEHLATSPLRYWLSLAFVLLVAPVLLPFGWTRLLRLRWVARVVQAPYPTPWDWYFSRRRPVFMLIHLTDGSVVGGYWGEQSYASSYPEQGDLYLSAVYKVDDSGQFEAPLEDTDGLLIRKDQYSYLELFKVPMTEVANEQEVKRSRPEDEPGLR